MKLSPVFAFAVAVTLGASFAGEALAQKRFGVTKLCCSACQYWQWVPGPTGAFIGKSIRLNPPRCIGGERVLISKHCPWGKYTCT